MKTIKDAYMKMIHKTDVVDTKQTEQLVETTVPEELHPTVESWDHHGGVDDETYQKITKAMTHGSFTHFPLDTANMDADPDVIEHLTKHGYDIKDYGAGIATTKKTVGDPSRGIPMRTKHVEEKIGAILEKTQASPEVKSSFMNDPARTAAKSKDQLHVVVSTTPLAIAGMTTGTSWKDQSCMNMQGGSYAHKLPDDSYHGTHVAFLVRGDDHTAFKHGEPSHPIARIALKPYHTSSKSDTIFRPENRTYGTDSTLFNRSVAQWASKHYPAIDGETYHKNTSVYDDTNNNEYHSIDSETVEHKIENGERFGVNTAIDSHMIDHAIAHTKEHFSKPREDGTPDVNSHILALRNLTEIPNLSSTHVAKIIGQLNSVTPKSIADLSHTYKTRAVDSLMAAHGDKVPTSMMDHWVDSGHYPTRSMMMNPKLSDRHLDRIDVSDYRMVRQSKIGPKHMDKLVENLTSSNPTLGTFRTLDALKDKLSDDHLTKLATHSYNPESISTVLMDSPKFSRQHHEILLQRAKQSDVAGNQRLHDSIVRNSPHVTVDDVEANPSPEMYANMMLNKRLSDDQHKALHDKFMENAVGGRADAKQTRYDSHVAGFHQMESFDENTSKHFTNEDMDKLAKHNYITSFDHIGTAHKYLDAMHRKAESMDSEIDDHIDHHESSDEDYDPSEDDHLTKMKEDLQTHMGNYCDAMYHHMRKHAVANYEVKNWDESENLLNRVEKIHDMNNYATPKNSGKRDDTSHYNDNFHDTIVTTLRDAMSHSDN